MENNLKSKLCLWSLRGSLTLLALLPVLPLFVSQHLNPVRSFHDEWLAITLGLLAWLAALWLLPRAGGIRLPRLVLLPLALMAFIAVQAQLLPQVNSQHAQMGMLYLLWAALLMALVGLLAEHSGRERVGLWLAGGLTAAAVCATGQEVVLRLTGLFGWWGGTAQANNYADLLALGLASVLYLQTVAKPVWRVYLVTLAVVIIVGLSLTPSRSVWLYWLILLLLAWRWQRPLVRLLLAGLALYVLLQVLWASGILSALQATTAAERLYQEVGGAPLRQHIWQVAWQVFLQSPWLGQGFGQFDWAYFQAGQHIPELSNRMEHAHNVILHLLAELGIFPVLLLVGLLGFWLRQLLVSLNGQHQDKASDATRAFRLWLLMLAGILGLHSLLEYPLWYAQFLGLAAMILALGDDRFWPIRLGGAGIAALSGLLLSGLAIAGVHEWHYTKLEQASEDAMNDSSPRTFSRLMAVCKEANSYAPLLTPYIATIFTNAGTPEDEEMRPTLTTLTEVSYRFLPSSPLAYRQAEMQALNGLTGEAKNTMSLALNAYPGWADKFKAQLTLLSADDQKKTAFLREMIK